MGDQASTSGKWSTYRCAIINILGWHMIKLCSCTISILFEIANIFGVMTDVSILLLLSEKWMITENWKLSGSYGIAKYGRVWITKHNDQAPAVLLILCPTWFVFDFLTHDVLHQDGHCSLPSLPALQQQYVLANCSPPLIAVDQVTVHWGSWLFCAAENYPSECLSQWFFNSPRVSFLTS